MMRAVLDACVLVPLVPRLVLLEVAGAGLIAPLFSARIFEEWRRAAARAGPVEAMAATGEAAVMRARWPGGDIPPAPQIEARLWLPDDNDVHVLAAAIAGGAQAIVTFNIRDFPRAALAPHGLEALNPDALLTWLWPREEAALRAAATAAQKGVEALAGRPMPLRKLMKSARLPRFGKRLEGG